MQENAEGLGLGLGINLIDSDTSEARNSSVEELLPPEFKEKEYEVLGDGESGFVVLSKPLEESKHSKSEHFPNAEMEELKISFLIAGLNKEMKKLDEFLLVFEQLKTGNVVFTDPRPLEAWTNLLSNKSSKEQEKALYKSNKDNPLLSYGEWIVKHEKKQKISGVSISNSNSVYLKDVNQEEYNKVLRVNEVKKAA